MSESIVEWKPRPRNRVFIKLSGGRFFTVPRDETMQLETGMVLSDGDIERLGRIEGYFRGRDKAMRLLALRPRTRHEIKNALDALALAPSIRNGIIEELCEKGLIDDARVAREFVRARVELKRLGPHRLRFELKKRGVAAAIVDETLRSEFAATSQDDLAWDIVRRKLGSRVPDARDVRRLNALLQRKGLDYEVVNRVTYELLQRSHAGDTEE